MARATASLVVLSVVLLTVNCIDLKTQEESQLIGLLQRMLNEDPDTKTLSCDDYRSDSVDKQQHIFTFCGIKDRCTENETCCPTGKFSVSVCVPNSALDPTQAVEKPAAVAKPTTTTTTTTTTPTTTSTTSTPTNMSAETDTTSTADPPPKDGSQMQDDAVPSGICDLLPKNSLTKRVLSALLNTVDKRFPLIKTKPCTEVQVQDVCDIDEVCCGTVIGPACYPISETIAGDKEWCKNGTEICPKH